MKVSRCIDDEGKLKEELPHPEFIPWVWQHAIIRLRLKIRLT